ncbi:MarR family winged helix-turn-helix transcriptional regulator [Subtercola vilae]|uniref:MarR family transcriptional regulator n=1 Tax=Subtercola vilae TaxID=2056433 RepID=A0A4T2C195_9MICO|nr:MarR family transcriptional regulator [Subtercola vilae]TIH37439.1 MarR family transcriptional regulator [Subtercola vilae]
MPSEPSETTSGVGETPLVVDALVQLSFAVQLVLTRVASVHDLSVTQLRLLGILRDRTPSMAAIADVLELDRSSVSGLIDRAERRGLVVRRGSPTDARVTLVELTAAAHTLAAELVEEVSLGLDALLRPSSEADRAALVRLAATLFAAVGPGA